MRQPVDPAIVLLEDGTIFRGRCVIPGTRIGEVVFNTSMTGYQEILTDPSYRGQIVVMTQPHIGNYGVYDAAEESSRPWVEGFVARQFTAQRSGCGTADVVDYLRENDVPALDDIDTRALVRRLREHGSMRGAISSDTENVDELLDRVRAAPPMEGRALVDDVTCAAPRELAAEGTERFHLAVYDFGVKENILRHLCALGARVTVLPARTDVEQCLALEPDGIVLSNGPGDPEPLVGIVETVSALVDSGKPVLGICLGHQLLGLAMGGKTFKLKFGHHGGNQPVRDCETGEVAITSQNHGFALDADSLPEECRITGINLNDGTVEGFEVVGQPVFSVQYHPEAAPGPHDAARLFGAFVDTVAASA